MSFGFTAIGTRHEVIAQCRSHNLDHGGSLATEARDLIVRALENDTSEPYGAGRYAYIVKASGHSGGSSLTYLNLTIEAQWVPETAAEAVSDEHATAGTASEKPDLETIP